MWRSRPGGGKSHAEHPKTRNKFFWVPILILFTKILTCRGPNISINKPSIGLAVIHWHGVFAGLAGISQDARWRRKQKPKICVYLTGVYISNPSSIDREILSQNWTWSFLSRFIFLGCWCLNILSDYDGLGHPCLQRHSTCKGPTWKWTLRSQRL